MPLRHSTRLERNTHNPTDKNQIQQENGHPVTRTGGDHPNNSHQPPHTHLHPSASLVHNDWWAPCNVDGATAAPTRTDVRRGTSAGVVGAAVRDAAGQTPTRCRRLAAIPA